MTNQELKTLKGEVTKITFQNERNWSRFLLDGTTVCTGTIENLRVGMTLKISGSFVFNEYGTTFTVKEVLEKEEDAFKAERAFFQHFSEGIGEKGAQRILKTYGSDTFAVLEKGDIAALTKCKINKRNAEKFLASYKENKGFIPLLQLLGGETTKNMLTKIVKVYGNMNAAMKALNENPYRVYFDVDGFGFKKADKIAIGMGEKLNSDKRRLACVNYYLSEMASGEGDCYETFEDIESALPEYLVPCIEVDGLTKQVLNNAILTWQEKSDYYKRTYKLSEEACILISETVKMQQECNAGIRELITATKDLFVVDENRVYLKQYFDAETEVAKYLKMAIRQRAYDENVLAACIHDYEERKGFSISEEQRDALIMAVKENCFVLTGGPGRGKTTIIEILADYEIRKNNNVLMMAPTGRAAKRMTEATGYPAVTIHRQLASMRHEPIEQSLTLIIDEYSMVDLMLTKSLLKAFAYKDANDIEHFNHRIYIVGDKDQLASVGAGAVLRDLLASENVPKYMLTKPLRNSGSIVYNSDCINEGKKLSFFHYDQDFTYQNSDKVHLCNTVINQFIASANKYGLKDTMLLTAMRKGKTGVAVLNDRIQTVYAEAFQKRPIKVNGRVFYLGDRVMHVRNNYTQKYYRVANINGKLEKLDELGDLGIFNGDRGTIIAVKSNSVPFKDESGNSTTFETYTIGVLMDDDTYTEYTNIKEKNREGEFVIPADKGTFNDLELAYATTVHKAQGSEAKCVIMCYSYGDFVMLKRNLFYTGVTRAKLEFHAIGEEQYRGNRRISAFDMAIRNVDDKVRKTGLKERLSN